MKINITKEELFNLYIAQNLSVNEIAKKLNISTASVNRKLKEFSIKKDENLRKAKISNIKQTKTEEEKALYSQHISEARKGKGAGKSPWNKGATGKQVAWNKGKKMSAVFCSTIKQGIANMSDKKRAEWEQNLSVSLSKMAPWKAKAAVSQDLLAMTDEELAIKYLEEFSAIDFPIPHITSGRTYKLYNTLKTAESKAVSNTAIDIVLSAHPSIWRCNRFGYKAPIDAWYDAELMYKTILNRLKYIGKDLLPQDIVRGFSVAMIAPKVSVFRPGTAKYLIDKYLNKYNTIFDPCSGFSGRMLGACSLNKKYIGQDINSITVRESRQLAKELNLNADVSVKDSIYDTGEYECLFTCPPYGEKENWHQDIEILSSDEWITTCLSNYKCKAYLFVVDKTDKYKDYIVEELTNKSHLNTNNEKVILITKQA